jgi:hypothetical protein
MGEKEPFNMLHNRQPFKLRRPLLSLMRFQLWTYFAAFRKGVGKKRCIELPVCHITTDQQLFEELRTLYQRKRGWKYIFGLSRVSEITCGQVSGPTNFGFYVY